MVLQGNQVTHATDTRTTVFPCRASGWSGWIEENVAAFALQLTAADLDRRAGQRLSSRHCRRLLL